MVLVAAFAGRHGSGLTPLGRVCVAFTDRGLCAVSLDNGTGVSGALRDVRRTYPHAEFREDQQLAGPVLRQLRQVLEGKRTEVKAILDLPGTPFQKRVWKALQQVPAARDPTVLVPHRP